jgi:hypothetical protein
MTNILIYGNRSLSYSLGSLSFSALATGAVHTCGLTNSGAS